MKRHQQVWWGRCIAAVTVLTVAGCTPGGTSADPQNGRTSGPGAGASSSQTGDSKPSRKDGTLPGVPSVAKARSELARLKVAPHGPMTGYNRASFPHWAEQGDNCDTRETVLERTGTKVRQDKQCRAVSGKWVSAYDDKKFTAASGLDIDHIVPLANAWRSGARSWNTAKRKAFANDLTHPQLLAVSASSNRSKGDQGPDEWQPPSKRYWCTYGRAWTSIKSTYELSITKAEKKMLTTMLNTCTS
ncbi:HNH endonuclease family protein [Streptomyces sp. NPDC048506]|uniref:HNH endonuclease family protein n=1 Tax=Streptomyces sp. NPDC048506 TaxID=3155028 RepID=UPI003430BADD